MSLALCRSANEMIIQQQNAKSSQLELTFFDSQTEAQLYHNVKNQGFFSILSKHKNTKHQNSYKLPMMAEIIKLLPKDRDTWLSQAEFFKPNRRIINLSQISLLFVDVDCYNVNLKPKEALAAILNHCDEIDLPHPSIAIDSGRGLQLKWLLDKPIPRHELPKWNAAQAALVDIFVPVGGDHNAKDASRVLRLVGTVNSKSGEYARVIYTNENHGHDLKRHDFEYLCEFINADLAQFIDKKSFEFNHPYTVEEQISIADEREKRQKNYEARQKNKQNFKLIEGKNNGLKRFSGRQLAWHRVEDIRKLVQIRGGVTHGQSMTTLFWSLNFLLLSGATNSSQMYYEAAALCREYGFGEFTRSDELSTLYAKAKSFGAGEKIKFNGREYPALYTPKNQTLIDAFEITDIEQKQLRTIICKDIKNERHRERERTRKHATNEVKMSRESYLSLNENKRVEARLMKAKGLSNRAIARDLNVSEYSIRNWVR